MTHIKQGAAGWSIFVNQQPLVKTGLPGRTLFTSMVPRSGIAGAVLTTGVAGFLGAELDLAEIYEITLADGTIGRFADHARNIVFNGHTWQALPIKRGRIRFHNDLQVDKVEIEVGLVGVAVGTRSFSLAQVVRRQLLRHARVRIYVIDPVKLDGVSLRFEGYVTDSISYTRGVLQLKVGSLLDRLAEKFPKLIYSEGCNHRLFDSNCKLSRSAWQVNDVVASGSTPGRLYAPCFAYAIHPAGWFDRGEVRITGPAALNHNVSRTVLFQGDGFVDLLRPFFDLPLEGESLAAWPGCDRSGLTCDEKFNNYANFFGFEYIPKPEILYG